MLHPNELSYAALWSCAAPFNITRWLRVLSKDGGTAEFVKKLFPFPPSFNEGK
jgi:hypothetical protein